MNEKQAIQYAERHGEITEIAPDPILTKATKEKYSEKHQKVIKKIMKQGKIFGDPIVTLKE